MVALNVKAPARISTVGPDHGPSCITVEDKERIRDNVRWLLEARVMDGTALELDDATFDVACSQFGIMLFPDRHKGLLEKGDGLLEFAGAECKMAQTLVHQ
jgi:ubiquinone/menaquinone biosynthesis C-methylase UbiE